MEGNIVIYINPGYYELSETLEFTESDSGKNGYNIIYRGTDKENPPVISGGVKVTDWESHNGTIMKASVNGVDEVRNLYINGFARQRARSKYVYKATSTYSENGSSYSSDGLLIAKSNFPVLTKPQNAELCWYIQWAHQRLPVCDIDYSGTDVKIAMDQPYWHWSQQAYVDIAPGSGKAFYIENDITLLDEPGEFYYDKAEKVIYYYPFEEDGDLNNCEIFVPKTEGLISVKGSTSNNLVRNIKFENLDIRYGAWNKPSNIGYVTLQADRIESGAKDARLATMPLAQIEVSFAEFIEIKNCKLSNFGSAGIKMDKCVKNSKINGNVIRDISGTGIIIGSWATKDNTNNQCRYIDIENNAIRRTAVEYQGSTAISVYYEKNIDIMHNDIREIPYSAVSLGWGWGKAGFEFGNYNVSYNRIEDFVIPPIKDGGGIYTLGNMIDSDISYNYIRKLNDAYGGIYTDEGSDGFDIHHNVVADGKTFYFNNQGSGYSVNVYSNYTNIYPKSGHGDVDTVYTRFGNWSSTARGIMNSAGLTAEYSKLTEGLDLPAYLSEFLKNAPTKQN